LLLFCIPPIKPADELPSRRLTETERSQFSLSGKEKEILVGLLLGDISIEKPKAGVNARLFFKQGIIHKDYLLHLYELFSIFCSSVPKVIHWVKDKRSGKEYSAIYFTTYCLPCFTELYELFYPDGKKVIPANIGELITPLGLAY
jgi:hypothetical protein